MGIKSDMMRDYLSSKENATKYMVLGATSDDEFLQVIESHMTYKDAKMLANLLLSELDADGNSLYEQINICKHADYIVIK